MARMTFNMVLVQALPTVQLREGERVARERAMDAGLRYWKSTYLPRHFGMTAAQRYGYARRLFEYLRMKGQLRHLRRQDYARTLWEDRAPLRKTGAMKAQLMGQRGTTRSVTSAGDRTVRVLVMRAPRYLYQYRQRRGGLGQTPNKARELTTITDDEMEKMLGVTAGDYVRRMASLFRRDARRRGNIYTLGEAREMAGRMIA